MPAIQDNVDGIVSFDVYPASILGSTFNRVKVLSIVDPDTAKSFLPDIAALHANVYPTLPVGTSNRWDGYKYAKIQFGNGSISYIGVPWIDSDTIEVHANTEYVVRVFNSTAEQYEKIRNALISNGIVDFDIRAV